MRLFPLLLLLSIISSCGKKTNEINSYRASSSFISEKALIIPHSTSGSVIRPKLLNKIVEESFPRSEVESQNVIQIHDELNNIELSEGELKDYEIKEKILTKVIVSYSDREEVYFIQEKIPVKNIISVLSLTSEVERKFKIIHSPHSQSYFGATFYIVSLNHEDLMENDQNFYVKESVINNFQQSYHLENFKRVLVKVNYEFNIQSLAPIVYTAPKVRCSKDLLEAGACGNGCSYTSLRPVQEYTKGSLANIDDLRIMIKLGDDLIRMSELSLFNVKEDSFEFQLDNKKTINENTSFHLLQMPAPVYYNNSKHYNFSSNCNTEDKLKVSSYGLKTQVNLKFELRSLGRGEELKVIKL